MKSLRRVCRRILDFCLGLGKGEKVFILFDRTNRELALSFEEEASGLKAIPQLFELPYGEKTASFPKSVLTMAENLLEEDALVVLSSGNMIHSLSIHNVVSPFQGSEPYVPAACTFLLFRRNLLFALFQLISMNTRAIKTSC